MNMKTTYKSRNEQRQRVLEDATMGMVVYFMGLGDDQPTAEQKVKDLSTEVADKTYIYVLGNTQPLIDAINASILPFMDAAAKTFATDKLTPPT